MTIEHSKRLRRNIISPAMQIVLFAAVFTASLTAAATDTDETWNIEVKKEVPYLGDGRKEKLDLYLPKATDDSRRPIRQPAIVIIHGGGWHGGDKAAKREQNIGNTLAGAGFVCASINYELCDKTDNLADRLNQVWPRNLHDCKTAVRFLRKHADKYNIDPNHIGAIGGSAGGHLVAMLAVTDSNDGLEPDGPYGDYSSRIQAVVPMYGVHDVIEVAQLRNQLERMSEADRELCRNASPTTFVTKDDPPALILHGTADKLVPVKQSHILFDKLQQASVDAKVLIIDEAPHSFHLQPKQKDLRPTVIRFFKQHLIP